MLARAIQHETDHLDGILFVDRLDREARKEAMKFIREAEWFGEPTPAGEVLAPRHQRPRDLTADAGRLRRHPRGRPARPRGGRGQPARAGRRGHPAGRPGRSWPQAGGLAGGAARRGARRTRAQARAPARPRLPGGAARAAPRLLPGGRLRRAAAAVGAGHPGARLGQPALLGAAGVARRRAGAARHLGRRRGHRRDHVPHRQGARRRADLRPDDPDHPARTTPRATCSSGWPRAAPGCWCRPSTASRTAPWRRASSRPTGSASRPKITVEDARVDWTEPAIAVDRRIRACTPDPGAWSTLDGERIKLGPVRPVEPASDLEPGRARGDQERRVRRHRHRTRSGWAGSSRTAARRWTPPTGPVASGSSPAPGSASSVAPMAAAAPGPPRGRRRDLSAACRRPGSAPPGATSRPGWCRCA